MWDSVGKLLKRLNTRLKKPKKKKEKIRFTQWIIEKNIYIYTNKKT